MSSCRCRRDLGSSRCCRPEGCTKYLSARSTCPRPCRRFWSNAERQGSKGRSLTMESIFAHAHRKKTMPAIFAIALGLSFFLSGGGLPDARAAEPQKKRVVFLGDSLTAGLGVQP